MSQTEWILEELKRGRSVSPIDALAGCQCFRLAARVQELRERGNMTRVEITGLSPATTYYCKVVTVRADGVVATSSAASLRSSSACAV